MDILLVGYPKSVLLTWVSLFPSLRHVGGKTRCRDHEESLEETCRPQPASELELMYMWNISFVFYIIYIPDLCLFGFEFPIEWLALE